MPRALPTWQYWMVDEAGNTLADLSLLRGVTISYPRRGPATLQGALPLTSAAAAAIPDGAAYVKAYRTINGTKTLRFYGPLELDEVSGDGDSGAVTITAYDPLVYLATRYTGLAYTATQRATIIMGLVDEANTDDDTGIRTSASLLESTPATTVDFAADRPTVASVIDQFAEAVDGCDVEVIPTELASGKIGDLYVYASRGSVNTGVCFGFGPGTNANCTGMRRIRNRSLIANEVTGFYGGGSSVNYTDPTSINTYRLRQSEQNLTGESSATEAAQRTNGYISGHVDANAVAEYSVTAGPRAPRLWDDFVVGDTVTLDFAYSLEFQATQRVENVTLTINDEGVEYASEIALRGAL